ncbi:MULTISPECIES: sensor histidine kinase [unclassified Nocardioides]|uniref:sensor histidine kinase n=1 Tax=unclassified Nocardioides TaxID=2615069 RepID=UPI0011747845|nr:MULTISPECIES: sensor domain-containing protein [unclassified Nocardioides]TQK68489.1 signal transduction histidine kinase [Nocardioides sp. SLBN-35]WGY02214.1 sensor domain-containing protein [Nocardioides sp. QY071]
MQPVPIRRAGPLKVTGAATAQVLLFVPVIVVFVLVVVSSVLTVVWIGILLLLGVLPLGRLIANTHRRMAAAVLGEPVPAPYLPLPPGPLPGLRARALDPATWRDLLWMLWAMTGGIVLSLLVFLLMVAVVTLPLWWYGAVPLMRARSWVDRAILSPGRTEALERRVHDLTTSRAVVVDHSAAELRRIERDLHDGPQARLAAVSLSLGLADDLFETDPLAARKLLNEARGTSSTALGELRDVVRGIHPPVLADRGLTGAVSALALDMAVPVELALDVPDRLPAPVESAVYFAVAECLANTAKHAGAAQSWVTLHHDGTVLRAEVGDDGRGGADLHTGSGLPGVAARLAAFDGILSVSSPAGGPTVVTWEVPCAPSA